MVSNSGCLWWWLCGSYNQWTASYICVPAFPVSGAVCMAALNVCHQFTESCNKCTVKTSRVTGWWAYRYHGGLMFKAKAFIAFARHPYPELIIWITIFHTIEQLKIKGLMISRLLGLRFELTSVWSVVQHLNQLSITWGHPDIFLVTLDRSQQGRFNLFAEHSWTLWLFHLDAGSGFYRDESWFCMNTGGHHVHMCGIEVRGPIVPILWRDSKALLLTSWWPIGYDIRSPLVVISGVPCQHITTSVTFCVYIPGTVFQHDSDWSCASCWGLPLAS